MTQPEVPRKSGKRTAAAKFGAVALVALVAGAAIGYGGTPEPEIVTRTVTETVQAMPAPCQNAYLAAEEAFLSYDAEGPITQEALQAAVMRNVTEIELLTTKISLAKGKTQEDLTTYLTAKMRCEEQTGLSLPAATP